MITKKELEPILKKISDNTLDHRCEDREILYYNLEHRVFEYLPEPLSNEMKSILMQCASETLEACHSLCINHDAEVIKAVLAYIRKSL